jgi:23S rRNA maturation-related 3'-5' exoribonuclease YhaM
MGERLHQALEHLTAELSDISLQRLVCGYLKSLPDSLADLPATSSGNHHPPKDNAPGGLVWHTRTTFRILDTLIHGISRTSEAYDHIKIGALIHDLGKYGRDGDSKHTLFEHPLLGAKMFSEFCLKKRLTDKQKQLVADVVRVVERHHGQYNTSKYSKITLPKAEKVDELLLHFADMVSSSDYFDALQDEKGVIPGELPF